MSVSSISAFPSNIFLTQRKENSVEIRSSV